MYEDQCKADRDCLDSDASSSDPTPGRDTMHSPLGPASSPLRFNRGSRDEKHSTDSEQELDPQEERSGRVISPGPEPPSPVSPRSEERVKEKPSPDKKDKSPDSRKDSDSIFSIRNLEKDQSESRHQKGADSSKKEAADCGSSSSGKDGFAPLMVQTESPSHFTAGHLQSLALSGLHGQQFFNPLNTGQPLFIHPGQFAMGPGAFSAMGMGHLLASMSSANSLENGSMAAAQAAGGSPVFPFHLSQHMLAASQVIPLS
ncbi:UNVERIFIED_CONTAM: hypothetical protein FKN15_056255 [Acipenser sinensis]